MQGEEFRVLICSEASVISWALVDTAAVAKRFVYLWSSIGTDILMCLLMSQSKYKFRYNPVLCEWLILPFDKYNLIIIFLLFPFACYNWCTSICHIREVWMSKLSGQGSI